MPRPKNFSEKTVLSAIKGSGGVILTVARALQCNRHTAEKYIDKWESTRQALEYEGRVIIDEAKYQIFEAIKNGDIQSAKWLLSRRARDEGYGDAVEIKGTPAIPEKTLEDRMNAIERSIGFFYSAAGKLNPLYARKRYIVLNGGRAGGKSIQAADQVIVETLRRSEGGAVICGREIQNSLDASSKALLERRIREWEVGEYFDILQNEIRCKVNGVVIHFVGLREATKSDAIKSFDRLFFIWIEEAQAISARTIEKLIPTLVRNDGWRLLATMNRQFEDDAIIAEIVQNRAAESLYIHINYTDNPYCPADIIAEAEAMRQADPRRYEHIYLGEPEKAGEEALFNEAEVKAAERYISFERQNYTDLVIAVDPATTNTEHSNEYGVILIGARENGECDVVDDFSGNMSVSEFVATVSRVYDEYIATAVVVETNAGGDFIRQVLLTENPKLHIVEVKATRDKVYRAQPIANKIATGKLYFIKHLPTLKTQMARMTRRGFIGKPGESPDRVDALGWGVYYLFGLSEAVEEEIYIRNEWITAAEELQKEPSSVIISDGAALAYYTDGQAAYITDYSRFNSGGYDDFISAYSGRGVAWVIVDNPALSETIARTEANVSDYTPTGRECENIVNELKSGIVKAAKNLPAKTYGTAHGDLYRREVLSYDGKTPAPLLELTAYLIDWEGLIL